MRLLPFLIVMFLAGCATNAPDGDVIPRERFVEVSPNLRVDIVARVIAFDAEVAIDAHDPATPLVFLELIACSPDSREHESLLVTRVTPSLLHAALLSIGLEPGTPARFRFEDDRLVAEPPTGDAIEILIETGAGLMVGPEAWIVHETTGEGYNAGGYVFAGSRIATRQGRERYDADGTGTVIGLAAFGSEVIAPRASFSPEATLAPPAWIADRSTIPTRGTPVLVRLRAIEPAVRSSDGP